MTRKTILLSAAAMLVSAGVAASSATGSSAGPLACAIEVDRHAGMATIEVVATSQSPVAGEYSFRLRGPGMNVNQGGQFEAAAGERVVLGQTTVSTGVTYAASLEVSAGGHTASCEKSI